jgi:uncharacterized membrane protein
MLMGDDGRRALALALLLSRPEPYDAIVPRSLPGSPRMWTYVSGVAELAAAAAVASPRTRRAGGYAAAALLTAVFPASLQIAAGWRHRSRTRRAVAYGRLPLQAPLIW